MENYDIVIVGAGPVGLYAAYYAGMRGLTVKIIENFDEPGGQPLNVYPEKYIYDIAAVPKINGQELTAALLEQLSRVKYSLALSSKVEKIQKQADETFLVQTDKESLIAKSILMTTGSGLLNPRPIGAEGEEEAYQSGRLAYFVKNLEDYRDKTVAVLGGGDSALDWALMLETVAKKVHLIHRRQAFRGAEATTEEVKQSSVEIHVPYTVAKVGELGLSLNKVVKKDEEPEELELAVDQALVFYGFLTEPTEIVDGLELVRGGKILVHEKMQTNISGLYAAGDDCIYEGKVPLIAVGFGEAVTAINDIASSMTFDHKLFKGHSSSIFSD